MNIFFDLDGTLIDSSLRLYGLFQHLVPSSKLSFDEYWNFKRNKISHRSILSEQFSFTDLNIDAFEKEWLTLIETCEWLAMDKPHEGVTEFLKTLSASNNLYIVTDRQFRDQVCAQINKFGWPAFFKQIFVTEQKKEKYELIRQSSEIRISNEDLFIGDTGKDIQNGKKLGIKTVAVCNGFLNETALLEYHPTMIIGNITQLKL